MDPVGNVQRNGVERYITSKNLETLKDKTLNKENRIYTLNK